MMEEIDFKSARLELDKVAICERENWLKLPINRKCPSMILYLKSKEV